MDKITGAKLAAQALVARNVRTIFTLSGGHITPLYQHLEGTGVELFDTRHEQAAVFMAEAWGKLTKTPGTAMVTAGPGFTNALTGIASASLSNTPLVLIAGAIGLETRDKLDLQDMRQAPVIESMVKKTYVCAVPERAGEYVDLAYRTAASGRPGPVYLEFPVDVLNAEAKADRITNPRTECASRPVDIAGAEKLMEMIGLSSKPIVIGGSGIWYGNCGDDLRAFIEAAGLPLFTFALGRGVVPDTHPLCFESSLAIRPGAALFASMSADLVVILGSRLSLFNIFGGIFNSAAKIAQVDILPEELGRNRTVDLPVAGDTGAFVRHCLSLAKGDAGTAKLRKRFAPWIEELRRAEADSKAQAQPGWTSENVPIHPLRLAREIDSFMDREDDIVIADGGDTTTWNGMTRTMKSAGHYLDYGLFGCLAVGLPYANAAKYLNPDKRVLLLTGDGSVGFNFMEFETSIRKGLPIVAVISNDLGWGMIRHSQEIRLGHSIPNGTFIGRVEYHRMVEALGGRGYLVEKPADIRPALEDAFASGKTCCINVMTDPTTVSPGSVALANLGGYKA
jgi:acetolactate synthase-1/2/3 large subunit